MEIVSNLYKYNWTLPTEVDVHNIPHFELGK